MIMYAYMVSGIYAYIKSEVFGLHICENPDNLASIYGNEIKSI
jgi:hypothetical protein